MCQHENNHSSSDRTNCGPQQAPLYPPGWLVVAFLVWEQYAVSLQYLPGRWIGLRREIYSNIKCPVSRWEYLQSRPVSQGPIWHQDLYYYWTVMTVILDHTILHYTVIWHLDTNTWLGVQCPVHHRVSSLQTYGAIFHYYNLHAKCGREHFRTVVVWNIGQQLFFFFQLKHTFLLYCFAVNCCLVQSWVPYLD